MKTCTRCFEEFPATREYFYRHTGRADGLECVCKKCRIIGNNATPRDQLQIRAFQKFFKENLDQGIEMAFATAVINSCDERYDKAPKRLTDKYFKLKKRYTTKEKK